MDYTISHKGFKNEEIGDLGNRFLIGNGYAGIRGTLEEDKKDRLAAITLAGIYDKVGKGWREPLNAPNIYYTALYVNEEKLLVDESIFFHQQELDISTGIRTRETIWLLEDGTRLSVQVKRFASMDNPHFYGMEYILKSSDELKLRLVAGIDGDVWDQHGPHYAEVTYTREDDLMLGTAYVQNSKTKVCVARKNFISKVDKKEKFNEYRMTACSYDITLEKDKEVILKSLGTIYTTEDTNTPNKACYDSISSCSESSYKAILKKSVKKWTEIWDISRIYISGDPLAEKAINYSIYHLNIAAPRHRDDLSIPARALSAQTYKGAIFWDTEVFMLDYFLHTQEKIARALVKYRIDTLEGALEKAEYYGYQGAFYPWESQEGGYDACSDYNVIDVFTKRPVRTYFKDKQVHISAAIVLGIDKYVQYTGDQDILKEKGAQVIIECAKFYWSLLVKSTQSTVYEIRDVIGPDEYHERVNNNAYTNKMAYYVFNKALEILELLRSNPNDFQYSLDEDDFDLLKNRFQEGKSYIKLHEPNMSGLIEQFDGYFSLEDVRPEDVEKRLVNPQEYWGGASGVASDTQVIKQADVVAMLALFDNEYSQEILRKNYNYYESRTEHGSSLSACMYGLVASRIGENDKAYRYFLKSAMADLKPSSKEWAGLVYIGGSHPAAAGGAWKNVVEGFVGLKVVDGKPRIEPRLPSHIDSIKFSYVYQNEIFDVTVSQDTQEVRKRE